MAEISLFDVDPKTALWCKRDQSVVAAVTDVEAQRDRRFAYERRGFAVLQGDEPEILVGATQALAEHAAQNRAT